MDTKREPMLIGIVTLLLGLGLGAGLGAWFVKSSQADNVPRGRTGVHQASAAGTRRLQHGGGVGSIPAHGADARGDQSRHS